jgi:hypothetical protein
VEEAEYVKKRIDRTRQERDEVAALDVLEATEKDIGHSLDIACDRKARNWCNQLAQLDMEEELALRELQMKWEDARDSLDLQWKSEHAKSQYDKPSGRLIELRRLARKLLAAHRFEESAVIAGEIESLEKSDAADACRRMNAAYENAVRRIDGQFKNDRDTIITMFLTRRNHIERSRDARMMPVTRKVEKYTQKKEALEDQQKRKPTKRAATGLATNRQAAKLRQTTIAANSTKLELPPVAFAKRKDFAATAGIRVSKKKAHGSNVATGGSSTVDLSARDDS